MHNRPTRQLLVRLRTACLASALVACVWPVMATPPAVDVRQATTPKLEGTQQALLDSALARLAPQRPGVTDMYVLGVAGDSDEDVFRNEVVYLQQLSSQRWDAAGRMVSLINHPQTRTGENAMPLATYESLGYALDTLGKTLDPEEDVLFLYLSSHGLSDNSFYLHTGRNEEDYLAPGDLAQLLDHAKIGNAVIVVSACFAGGFIPALQAPNRMIITAARKDRPSFGCGNTDSATWFGRAFLVEAMNTTNDFNTAYSLTKMTVRRREKEEGERPSEPQFLAGQAITDVLAKWRGSLPVSAAVPYPFVYQPKRAVPIRADKAARQSGTRKGP
ncbi:C13 family peptidase [Stenotrophomonas sp. Iso1]|uniref:C13 family peptidase n=1 Tax=Stenotrophomonas sp. Iso1 TaxID=2977283 RepID=UPI0022B7B945|nr:C13 family peptidase [Stenotrophomonas sp. Iso1]